MAASHEVLEHTGELRLRVRAPNLGELLAEAGSALGEVLLQHAEAGIRVPMQLVTVRSPDRDALLVDWLNELVFRADTMQWIPREFEVVEASDTEARAWVQGVHVAEAPALVKAATHHGLRITDIDGGLQAEIVLDV